MSLDHLGFDSLFNGNSLPLSNNNNTPLSNIVHTEIETKDVDMSIDSADDQESVEYNEPLQSIKRLFDDSKNTIEIVFHDTDTPGSAQSDLCSKNSALCESENLGKRMRNRPKRFKDYETSFK